MAADEDLVDVRADEQQQQVRGALEAEPRTKPRLRYQELQYRSVALRTPALVEDNDLGRIRIAVCRHARNEVQRRYPPGDFARTGHHVARSEEHTSELQSRLHLVCRLLLEKKKN